MGNTTKVALNFQAMNLDSILNALKDMINLSGKIQLPKDLMNQINDLTQSIVAMKASTETLGKTKVDAKQFKELAGQFKGIEHRVEILEKAVSAIFSGAGANNQLVNKITEIKNTVTDTTSAIKEMGQSLKQATDNVSPDEKKLTSYRKQLEILKQIKEIRGKEGSISDSKASKASVEKQIEMLQEQLSLAEKARDAIKSGFDNKQWGGLTKNFEKLNDAVRSIETLEDNFKGKKLLDDYSYKDSNLQTAIDSIRHSYSDLSKDINTREKAINNHLNGILKRIAETSKQTIQEVKKAEIETGKVVQNTISKAPVTQTIHENLGEQKKQLKKEFVNFYEAFNAEHTEYSKTKTQITIPLRISRNQYELLYEQINEVVKRVQETVSPIEVRVALVSGYKTKKNEELVDQLSKSLANIDDEKVRNEASKLIETLQKKFSEQIHLNIKVAGDKKATRIVQEAVKNIQDTIDTANKEKTNIIQLQAKLSDESITAITEQLQNINWKPINIDLKRTTKGKNRKDSKSTQEELTPLGLIKATIDEITGAINAKTDAFKSEAEIVATESLKENSFLLILLESFEKIRNVLSEIKGLSGTIGNIQFNIDGANLATLVDAAGQVNTIISNSNNKKTVSTSTSIANSKQSNNIKREKQDVEELNIIKQNEKQLQEQINNSVKENTQIVKARNEEEQKFVDGLIIARDMARNYGELEEAYGHEDIVTKEKGIALLKHLQELTSKYQNSISNIGIFDDIASWDDSRIQTFVRSISDARNKQNELLKSVQNTNKKRKEELSYVEKMDATLESINVKATKYNEKISRKDNYIKNNTKTLTTDINNTNSKYPLNKNASKGLWKFARNSKSEMNEAATEILRLAGEYVKTGSIEILDKLKDYTKSSNLSDKMKASIENSINRFINQLAKQVETTGKQAINESIIPAKMKTVTMNKGQYKEWYQATSGLGDSEFFDRNFERQVNGLISQGKAKKSGNSYSISVDIEEKNLKLLEEFQTKWENQKKKNKKSVQELTKEINNQSQVEENANNKEIVKTEQIIQKKQEEAKSVQAVTEAVQQQQQEVANLEKVWSKEELEAGFQQVKNNIAKYGNFNLSKKTDKEGLAKQVGQYIRYQQFGGTRPITDLTDNQKALSKITAEYEKQKSLKNEINHKNKEQIQVIQEIQKSEEKITIETQKQSTSKENKNINNKQIEATKEVIAENKKEEIALKEVGNISEETNKKYVESTNTSVKASDVFLEKIFQQITNLEVLKQHIIDLQKASQNAYETSLAIDLKQELQQFTSKSNFTTGGLAAAIGEYLMDSHNHPSQILYPSLPWIKDGQKRGGDYWSWLSNYLASGKNRGLNSIGNKTHIKIYDTKEMFDSLDKLINLEDRSLISKMSDAYQALPHEAELRIIKELSKNGYIKSFITNMLSQITAKFGDSVTEEISQVISNFDENYILKSVGNNKVFNGEGNLAEKIRKYFEIVFNNFIENKLGYLLTDLEGLSPKTFLTNSKASEIINEERNKLWFGAVGLQNGFDLEQFSKTYSYEEILAAIQQRIDQLNQSTTEATNSTNNFKSSTEVATQKIESENTALKENKKAQEKVNATKKEQQQLNQQTSTESNKIQSNIEKTTQLYDTLGRKIDSNNSKILEGTKVIEESTGRIKVLYHGSNNDFDKFDPNLIGSRGTKFGSGAYFTFDEASAKAYGTKVSEWFANITKIYENNAKLSEEELTQIFNKYKDKIQKLWGSIDLKTFLSKMSEKSSSEQLSLLGDKITGLSEAGLLRELGYQGRTFQHGKDGGIVIFNLDNVIKANKVLSEIKEKVGFKNNALKFLLGENINSSNNEKVIQAQNTLQQELNKTSQAAEKILQTQQAETNAERENINVAKEQIQVQQELAESKKKVSQSSETPVLANSKDIKAEEQKVTAESANGMIQGMEEKEQEIYDKAEAIALGALKVVKKALDIKSPSGEFRKVGIAIIEGMIKGMEEKAPDLNNTITNITTNALKISKDIVNQNNFNPLTDLQNSKKNFEPFYKDSKQLATKEGQEAALQYYIAYQKALEAKVNKKDLQANTLGKMSELFSGNYSNYKKGVGAIDTSGLTTTIETTKQKLEQLSQPQTINNLEALTITLQKLTGEGKDVEYLTNMLKSLISVFNLLSNDKSADRLVKIQDNLSKFATSLSQLKIDDNGLLSQIDNILKKSDELKTLSDVVKANKKAIDAAAKGVNDETSLRTASENFKKYYTQINDGWNKLVKDNSWTTISTQMEPAKDGLIHIKALVREVDDTYKELTYTTTNGDVFGLSKQKVDDLALQKKVNQYKELEALLARIIPDAGMIGQVTPDTDNWQELLDLLHRFGFEIQDVEKIIRNVDEVGHESFQIFDKLGNRTTLGVDSKEILFAKENVFDLNKDINDFNKSLKDLQGLSKKSFKLTNVEAVKLVETIQKLSDSFRQLQKGNINGMLDNDSLLNFQAQYEAVFKDLNKAWFNDQQIKNLNPEFVSRYKDLKVELEQIISLSNSDTFPTVSDIAQLDAFTQKAEQFYTDMANNNQKMSSAGSIDKLLGKIGKTLSDNDGMTKELRTQFEELIGRIRLARNESTGMLPTDQMKAFSGEYEKLKNIMIESGKTGKNFWSLTKDRLKSTNAQLVSMYFSFYRLIGYVRSMITTVIDLDSALLDLKKTTTMNSTELEEFYKESSNTAKEVGVTTKEIITQAAAWSRLGFSSKEAATEMSKLSSQFAKISPGTSVEDATDYLVSTMKAFHIDVADVESEIMDTINKIGNTMATSNAEVGEMLKRSSAAMAEANNTLSETIALESAAVQITRNAETTGTAFRTISMRIRGYDEETEELSEDYENLSGAIADLTKTAKTPGGISLFTDANKTEYKSTYQLLKEISEIYDDLTDKQQAELLEKLAGKRGGQVLASILNDFSEVERAMSEIEQSAGSAAKEMSVVEETLEYKINAFKTTWTGVVQTLIDKGTIGNIIDFFTNLSETVASIVSNPQALITVFSAMSGFIIALKGGNFISSLASMTKIIGVLKDVPMLTSISNGALLRNFDATKMINVFKGLEAGEESATTAMAGLTAAEQDLIIKSRNAGLSVEQFGTAMNSISTGARIAKTALTTLGNTAVMLAVTLVIKGLSKAYDEWAHKASKIAEKAKGLQDAFNSVQNTAKSNLETFDKLSKRAEELSKGVNYLGNNVSLTTDEFEEYKNIQQTIADMSPKLISGYDEQGHAIVYLKDNVDSLRQSYEDAQAAAYDLMIVGTGEEGSANATTMTENFLNMFRPGDFHPIKGRELSTDAKQRIAKFVRDNIYHLDFSSELLDLSWELQEEGYGAYIEDFYKELGISYRAGINEYKATNLEQTRSLAATMYQTFETSKNEGLNAYKQLFNSFLKRTGSEYYDLNEDYQKIVSTVINNIDLATAYELAEQGTGAVSEWVNKQISYIKDMPEEISGALGNLEKGNLDFTATKLAFDSLYNYLTNILGLDPDHPLVSHVKALYEGSNINKAAEKMGIDYSNPIAQKYWDDFLNGLEDEEINLILNADKAPIIHTIEDAQKWLDKLRNNYIQETTATIIDSVKQFNNELKPQFDTLSSAYDKIFNNEKGFNEGLKSIDIAWFESIRSAFEDIDESLNIDFDKSNIESFFDAIENGKNVTEEMAHDAFDDLATAYFYSAEGLQNLNEKTRTSIEQMMVQMGITKESAKAAIDNALAYKDLQEGLELVAQGITDLGTATQIAKDMNSELTISIEDVINADETSLSSIQKKILAYYEEIGATEAVRMASFLLALQELKEASIDLNVNDKITALENLATAYLSAAEAAAFEARMESLRAGAKYGDSTDRARIEAELNDVSGLLTTAFQNSTEQLHLNFDHVIDQAEGAGSESGKTYADEFEEALKNLQFLRDNDIITLKHYLDQEKKLIDDFYKAGKMSAEDYFKRIHDWLREMLDLYNSVISDVTKILQKEIDKLEKERDERIKQIEKERDAALEAIDAESEALDKKIKKKQTEIDLLEKANEKRKQEINLQKALYDMERARNQRTLLRYQEGADGKGQMVYRPDEKAVQDAREEVEEQQYQKRLKILQDEVELLNEEKDKLSEQREEIESHYQTLIDQTNEYYDSAIQRIQEYMEKWEELAELEERALMQSRLESLGLSIEDILNLDEGSFEAFKENYIGILADIYRENDSMTKALGDQAGSLNSYLERMQGLFDSLSGIDLTSVASAMSTVAPALQTIADCMPYLVPQELQDNLLNTNEQLDTMKETSDSTGNSLETAGSKGEEGTKKISDGFKGASKEANNLLNVVDGSSAGSSDSDYGSPKLGESSTGFQKGDSFNSGKGNLKSGFIDMGSEAQTASTIMESGLKKGGEEAHKTAQIINTEVAEAIEEIKGPHTIEFNLKLNSEIDKTLKGLGHGLASGYKVIGSTEYEGTVGNAFFNGYPGLNSPEYSALRSEYGQPELTVYPDGTYELTTTPTLSDLPKDTVIFNEEQTKRILKNSVAKNFKGKAFANGTPYLPLQDVMPDKAAIFDKFEANITDNLSKMKNDISEMTSNVREITRTITNNQINNNSGSTVNVGDINVTCPGVTEAEVARNLGAAIRSELNGVVSGMALRANQLAMRR